MRYGRLEKPTMWRVCKAVAREGLAQGEEQRKHSGVNAMLAVSGFFFRRLEGAYLFGNARSWLARLQRRLSGLNIYRSGSEPHINGSSNLNGVNRCAS